MPDLDVAEQAQAGLCQVTVVLPCLNEAATLEVCIRKAQASFDRLHLTGEVLVADNGSTDASRELAQAAGARVVDVPLRGYGAALRAGIAAARGEYVVMADADDSYALDVMDPFIEGLRGGADLVVGNRFRGGIEPGAMPALHRYLGNPVLSRLGRLFFRIPIGDFHCGMRAFRGQAVRDLGLRTTGMEFASEMLVRASLAGLRIEEVPTTLSRDGRDRRPHLRTWRDGWRHLRFLLAFTPRWLLLYPALLMTGLGVTAFIWLLTGVQRVGGVAFDLHTLVAAATCTLLGVQVGGLALASRAYGEALGLLPVSRRMDKLLRRVTLERGLVFAVITVLAGIACFVGAVVQWSATSFGELEVNQTMRLALSGMLLILAGTQVGVVSFMLSLTRIGDR